MASNGTQIGFDDSPAFPETDAPALGADLEEVARYARTRGNVLRGTTSERNAYAYPTTSLLWSDTNTGELWQYDGENWVCIFQDWVDWAPSVSNVTGGTVRARYMRVGKTIHFVIRHTLAGAGITGNPAYTRPVEIANSSDNQIVGQAVFRDVSAAFERGGYVRSTSAGLLPYSWAVVSDFIQWASITSSSPFTWAVNDYLEMRGSYEAAT